jgi:hypothetical protein
VNVLEIARRAELRLCRKYRKMTMKGKNSRLTVVSVARELAGFVWALGRSSFTSPKAIFPLTRKQSPPNIFFSETPSILASIFRTRSARSSLNAIISSSGFSV